MQGSLKISFYIKYLSKTLLLSAVLLLAGCAEPMSGEAIAAATKFCLDAGGRPQYFHNGGQTTFICIIGD